MMKEQTTLSDIEKLTNKEIVERYGRGLESINLGIFQLPEEMLRNKFPKDSGLGEWSCIELMGHLCDGEIGFTQRLRRVIAEEKPSFAIWDEDAFVKNHLYDNNKISDFYDLLKSIRQVTINWLSGIKEEQFTRIGIHPNNGEQSFRKILTYVTWHIEHHGWYLDRKIEFLFSKLSK